MTILVAIMGHKRIVLSARESRSLQHTVSLLSSGRDPLSFIDCLPCPLEAVLLLWISLPLDTEHPQWPRCYVSKFVAKTDIRLISTHNDAYRRRQPEQLYHPEAGETNRLKTHVLSSEVLADPSDEQKSQMLHVFLEGFKTGTCFPKLARPLDPYCSDRFVAHLCEGDEHREALSHLSRLESAYIDGEVWVIEIGGTIVSVAIWSAPGQTLWDT